MLAVVDVAGRAIRPITPPAGDIDWVADLNYGGSHALMIGRTGNLYVFDMTTRSSPAASTRSCPPMPASGTFPSPFIAVAEGVAYVSSPTRGRGDRAVALVGRRPDVARRIATGGTPSRIVVLGVRRGGTVVAAR
jgi:hypothetical protein